MKALVLGIGNILLSDEGVGVKAINALEKKFRFPKAVELLDGGTAGLELLPYLTDKKLLIVIDAVKGGQPPGTVFRVEGEDVPAMFTANISPHQLGLSNLLATARLTGELPKNIVLFGIEPESMDTRVGLSDTVAASLDKLIHAVVDELQKMGYSPVVAEEKNYQPGSLW